MALTTVRTTIWGHNKINKYMNIFLLVKEIFIVFLGDTFGIPFPFWQGGEEFRGQTSQEFPRIE